MVCSEVPVKWRTGSRAKCFLGSRQSSNPGCSLGSSPSAGVAGRRGPAQIIWGPEPTKARGSPPPHQHPGLKHPKAFLGLPIRQRLALHHTTLSLSADGARSRPRAWASFKARTEQGGGWRGLYVFPLTFLHPPPPQAAGFLGPWFSGEERPGTALYRQAFNLPWLRLLDQTQDVPLH